MGNKNVNVAPTGGKTVVIVGSSFAGQKLTQQLLRLDRNLKIVLVDQSPHFEFICNNPQLFTNNDFKENSISFGEVISSFGSNQVYFEQGKLVKVNHAENEIELEGPTDEIKKHAMPFKLSYDVLVLATGSSYTAPWRAKHDQLEVYTTEEREEEWTKIREEVKAAKSILCVGGGATGCETAAYIKEAHPKKTVGIALRERTLLPKLNGAHPIAETILKKQMKIQLHYNTTYEEGNEDKKIKTDGGDAFEVVIDCRGFKYLGPGVYLKDDLAQCIDKKTGQILVNRWGQMTSKHPLTDVGQPQDPAVYNNIFSFGDVCLTHLNEMKSIVSLAQLSFAVA